MKITILASALLAGLCSAAVVSAPAATATIANCQDNGSASVCQRPGHASIYATPNEMAKPGNSLGWPINSGPMPSILALD